MKASMPNSIARALILVALATPVGVEELVLPVFVAFEPTLLVGSPFFCMMA
jgi:hypothetical protein